MYNFLLVALITKEFLLLWFTAGGVIRRKTLFSFSPLRNHIVVVL